MAPDWPAYEDPIIRRMSFHVGSRYNGRIGGLPPTYAIHLALVLLRPVHPEVRDACCDAMEADLIARHDPYKAPVTAVAHAGPSIVPKLIEAFENPGDPPRGLTLLNPLSFRNYLRSLIIRSLGKIGGAPAVDFLLSLLDDPDHGALAIAALGEARDPKAVPALLDLLSNPNVRMDAILALASIGDGRTLEPILAILANAPRDERRTLVLALGTLGDARAIPTIVPLLKDPGVRSAAAVALRALHWKPDPEGLDDLAVAEGDLKPFAARGPSAIPRLIDFLSNPSEAIRLEVVTLLSGFSDPRSRKAVVNALMDQHSTVREAAAKGLGQIGDLESVSSLMDVLTDRWTEVGQAAATSLAKIADEKVFAKLLPMSGARETGGFAVTAMEGIVGRHAGKIDDASLRLVLGLSGVSQVQLDKDGWTVENQIDCSRLIEAARLELARRGR